MTASVTVQCHVTGCTTDAVSLFRLGCVHEHLFTTAGCQHHIDRLRAGEDGTCWLCSHSTEPHRCVVREVKQR